MFRWLDTNSLVLGCEDGTYASCTPFTVTSHAYRCALRAVEAVAESSRNAQVVCVAADGTLRLCDMCTNTRIRTARRAIPVFSVRPSGPASVVLRCHPGTPDAKPEKVDDDNSSNNSSLLPVLTTLAYCPEPENARLVAFGGTGSPIAFIGAIGYPLPYVT